MCGSLGTAEPAIGGQHEAAPVEQRLLTRRRDRRAARGPGARPIVPMNGAPGDADAGKVGRGGPAVGEVPADLEGIGELVAQEPEAGDLDGVAVGVGLDVEDLDVEQVARLGALDVDRVRSVGAADRGSTPATSASETSGPICPSKASRVSRIDLVAGFAPDERGDVGVPAVVAGRRLLDERLRPVDGDLEPGLHLVPPRLDRSCWPPSMS